MNRLYEHNERCTLTCQKTNSDNNNNLSNLPLSLQSTAWYMRSRYKEEKVM